MNSFSINAREIERTFRRSIVKKGYFLTLKGNINRVITYDRNHMVIQTDSKGGIFRISRSKLRKALTYVYFKRTVIRKDLEPYTSFTSALLGICQNVFKNISKVFHLKNGLFRLSLKGIRFFASGLERDPALLKCLHQLNGHFVLFNYFQLHSSKWLEYLEEYNMYAIIDSGAFSMYQRKQKSNKQACQQMNLLPNDEMEQLTLEGYAAFINQHKHNKRILGFFPLDVIGEPLKTKENYLKLKQLTDGKVYPVWQVTDSFESLEELVEEEHEMIGVGGIVPFLAKRQDKVEKILKRLFSTYPDVNFHFLGGANELLVKYNWFSSDSTAFLNARKSTKQRKVYLENGYRVNAPEHMSTEEIIKNNLQFLLSLECYKPLQLSLI